MSRTLDGRAVLRRLDGVISTARTSLSEAIAGRDQISRELTETRRNQAAAYLALARVQVSEADTREEIGRLAGLDGAVGDLIPKQEAFIEDLLRELDTISAQLSALEQDRERAAEALDSAIAAFETKVAEVEASLENDADYAALVAAAAEAESVTEHARAKLEVARADMEEKGEPFRADPLFMYLWKRGWRTPDYEGGTLTRFLDGWVASLCTYDKSYRNYERLTELPVWLESHVGQMEAREASAEAELERFEAEAMSKAGTGKLEQDVTSARSQLDGVDKAIHEAEERHLEIAARHRAAESGESGPAAEARQRLAEALRSLAFPDLRILASGTVTPEDDELVDKLVILRKDEMALELRLEQGEALPEHRREDLSLLEDIRRGFKSARMDSPYAVFAASILDDVVSRLLSRRVDTRGALRLLSRAMRRVSPQTDPRFGGSRRSDTLGLPDIAVGIGLEILKEMGRSSSRGGSPRIGGLPRGRRTSFPSPRRSSPRPSGPRPRGGFRTKGGF